MKKSDIIGFAIGMTIGVLIEMWIGKQVKKSANALVKSLEDTKSEH